MGQPCGAIRNPDRNIRLAPFAAGSARGGSHAPVRGKSVLHAGPFPGGRSQDRQARMPFLVSREPSPERSCRLQNLMREGLKGCRKCISLCLPLDGGSDPSSCFIRIPADSGVPEKISALVWWQAIGQAISPMAMSLPNSGFWPCWQLQKPSESAKREKRTREKKKLVYMSQSAGQGWFMVYVGSAGRVRPRPHRDSDARVPLKTLDCGRRRTGGSGMTGNRGQCDAYGSLVGPFLRRIQKPAGDLSRHFASSFYRELSNAEEVAGVLARLTADEFEKLKIRQAEHLQHLLAPDLTLEEHLLAAQRTGRIHALVGVDLLWVIEAYSMYQRELQHLLGPLLTGKLEERELVTSIVSRRILVELQGQVSSYRRIEMQTAQVSSRIEELIQTTANFSDLIRGAMAAIGSVDGEISAFFARVDANRELQVEGSYGAAGQRYHRAMMSGSAPKISISPDKPEGQGPGGRAWRSGRIVVSDAWALDAATQPWRAAGDRLGFRAAAAVPLTDEDGHSIALLSLYSAWPGCFSTMRMGSFLADVQRALSHAVRRRSDAPVLPLQDRQHYRRMLVERKVAMLYQPIINLQDGSLQKVEALARLVAGDGVLVAPGHFFPAFGTDELLELLQLGLEQCCSDCEWFERQGIYTTFAVNFPAEGIGDPRYEKAVFHALKGARLGPSRLQLEILESRERSLRDGQRSEFLQRLRDAGIRIVEDDLGSGYSSLLRLDQYGFDEVKIDQDLIRGALRRPRRALEFILYLTRMAHAFGMSLTVEGLEDPGMIEAAAILGADFGQGFGIARPMPASEIVPWHQRFRYPVDTLHPVTALGALSAYLLWDMQRSAGFSANGANDAQILNRERMEHFVRRRGLQDSELGNLLDVHLANLGEMDGHHRDTVISLLTALWFEEISTRDA